MEREIQYEKAGWKKYSNRLFPKYEKESWTVWVTTRKGVSFHSFENAVIFEKLVKLHEQLHKRDMI